MWVILIFPDLKTVKQSLRGEVSELGRKMKKKVEGTQEESKGKWREVVRRRRRENRSQDARAFVLTRKISGESREGARMVNSLCRVCGPGLRSTSLAHPSHMDLLGHAWPYMARFAKEDSVQHSVQCSLYSVTFFNLTPRCLSLPHSQTQGFTRLL